VACLIAQFDAADAGDGGVAGVVGLGVVAGEPLPAGGLSQATSRNATTRLDAIRARFMGFSFFGGVPGRRYADRRAPLVSPTPRLM